MTSRKPRAIEDLSLVEKPIEDHFTISQEMKLCAEDVMPIPSFWQRLSLFKIFLYALFFLCILGFYLWADNLIHSFFLYNPWLGYFATLLTWIAILSLLGFIAKEIWALHKFSNVDHMRSKALAAFEEKNSEKARETLHMLLKFTKDQKCVSAQREHIKALENTIMDYKEILWLAESEILAPLDKEARKIILASAKRISLITSLTPRLFVELPYILYESVRLIRILASLYGCRPGKLGIFALSRRVLAHLSISSGINLTDSFLQQIIGENLAARLSARLGEGFINGLLLTRIGIATIEALRPLPFLYEKKPNIKDFMRDIVQGNKNQKTAPPEHSV